MTEPRHEHHWSKPDSYDHKLLLVMDCTDKECTAVRITVGHRGSLDCPWHGPQLSSPCYSCDALGWRHEMVWRKTGVKVLRCPHVDHNGYDDPLRCGLIAGHSIGHRSLCASSGPNGQPCWLPYAHPGDYHANRQGDSFWVDPWIGPTSRKSEIAWSLLR